MNKRPTILYGSTHEVHLGYGQCWVVVNRDEAGSICEVFCYAEKSGIEVSPYTEALGRCISIGLRHGVPIEEYIDQLKDIKGPTPVWDEGVLILSAPDGIAKVLQRESYAPRNPANSSNNNLSSKE